VRLCWACLTGLVFLRWSSSSNLELVRRSSGRVNEQIREKVDGRCVHWRSLAVPWKMGTWGIVCVFALVARMGDRYALLGNL
jgi:hypothetical protein